MARAERPLDVGDSRLLEFAAGLRKLRAVAGSPAYRELSRRAHYSAAALSDAAGGRRLPSLSVTLAYVAACDGDTADWERRWHALAAELTAGAGERDDGVAEAPYVGLATFQPEDAERFFGRSRLVAELAGRVAAHRFVVLVGPSGSGKSSLLRAGLVHHTRTNGGFGGGPIVVMTPGAHPVEECAVHLADLTGATPGALRTDPESLHRTVLRALAERPHGEVLIVVDQFEEVFTLCRDPDERAQFVGLLHTAAQAPDSRARIVLGLRADFYAHCTHHPELVEALRDGQVLVGPMSTDELRSVITQPAHNAGCRVETALISRVVAEATGQPGVLPLVSHALLETWRRRRGTTLTVAGYDAAGGITQSIARTAEASFTTLSDDQQQWARQLFLRLVALGEGTEDTRRRIDRTELDLAQPDRTEVLERLAQARLVTLDRDSVELTHEALIRGWPRLHAWLTEDRDGLRIHRQLTEAARTWQTLHREPGALYRGSRLSQASQWTAGRERTLATQEREFLQASLSAQADEHADVQRRTRRLRRLVALLVVVTVLACTATVLAVRAQLAAAEQARAATRQQALAISRKVKSEAYALADSDQNLAVQLGIAAYRLAPTPENRDDLLRGLVINSEAVEASRFVPTGSLDVDISPDRVSLMHWPDSTSEPNVVRTLFDRPGNINSITFSPDSRILAIAGSESIRFWDITGPMSATELATHTERPPARGCGSDCFNLAFSPDGLLLAITGYNRTTTLWDISDPNNREKLAEFATPGEDVAAMVFSPDGHTLATGTQNHTTRLWDVTDPRKPTQLSVVNVNTGHHRQAFVNIAESVRYWPDSPWIAFSPDGGVLAAASSPGDTNHLVRLWDVTNPRIPEELGTARGHTETVTSVAFSPDGRLLGTASWDQTTRLWDITDRRNPVPSATLHSQNMPDHIGENVGIASSLSFSQDGQLLVTTHAGRALTWYSNVENAAAITCGKVGVKITRAQWDQYFPGVEYNPPCPDAPEAER